MAPGGRPAGITREQYILLLVAVSAFLAFDFVNPFMPLYVLQLGVRSMDEAAVWSGVVVGVSPMLASLASPLWGRLADRYGVKAILLRAVWSFAILEALIGLAANVWQLLGMRAIFGLMGGFTPLVIALMVTMGRTARAGSAIGLLQMSQFSAMVIAPLIGGVVADATGVRTNFFLAAILCGLSGVILARGLRSTSMPRAEPRTVAAGEVPASGLSELRFLVLPALLLLAAQFTERSFLPVLPLYLYALVGPDESVASLAGLAVSIGAGAAAVSSAVLGRLADHYPVRRLLVATLGGSVLLCLPIAFVGTPWHLLLLRGGLGLIGGAVPTLAYTLAAQISPPGRVARSITLLGSVVFLANGFGPIAAGVIAAVGLRAVFAFDAFLFLVALAALIGPARLRQVRPAGAGPRPSAFGRR